MDSRYRFHKATYPGCAQGPIRQWCGKAAEFAYEISLNQQFVSPGGSTFRGSLLFPGCHQSGKIQIILVGRRIRAVVETELAVITFLFDLGEILWRQLRNIAFVIINAVKQRIERWTQVEASAAAIANIKDP